MIKSILKGVRIMIEKNYEGELNFRMLLVALRRRWKTILYFLICFTIVGFVYGYKITKPSYKSTGSITVNNLDRGKYSTIINSIIGGDDFYEIVYNDLKNDEVKHTNLSEITQSEIKSGLTVPEIPSTITDFIIQFSFTNSDEKVVKPVLDSILTKIVEKNGNTSTSMSLSVYSEATKAKSIAGHNTKVVLVAGVGACLGILVAAFEGLRKYEIDTTTELTAYGINAFEINYKDGKKHE